MENKEQHNCKNCMKNKEMQQLESVKAAGQMHEMLKKWKRCNKNIKPSTQMQKNATQIRKLQEKRIHANPENLSCKTNVNASIHIKCKTN